MRSSSRLQCRTAIFGIRGLKISIGSVKTTSAELEELFTTEELETFFEELEELFDFTELEELLDFVELDDGVSFSLEDETLALLEELLFSSAELEEDFFVTLEELLPFSKLELVSASSSELEEVSGSTPFTPEESPPQATKKNNEKKGNKLQIFIS